MEIWIMVCGRSCQRRYLVSMLNCHQQRRCLDQDRSEKPDLIRSYSTLEEEFVLRVLPIEIK